MNNSIVRKILKNITLLFLFVPFYAYALTTDQALGGLAGLVDTFTKTVVRSVGTLFLTMAVVAFFWGMVQFIWAKREGGDGAKMKVGQEFMAWGLTALFVMFSVWGIISFFGDAVGIKTGGNVMIPSLQFNLTGTSPVNGVGSNINGVKGTGGNVFGTSGGGSSGGGAGSVVGAAKQATNAVKTAEKALKSLSSYGGCPADSDGTTYHVDPKDKNSCLPDSECPPNYISDPKDSKSCILDHCPAEEGVTFHLQGDQCIPDNGGCAPGETKDSNDNCISNNQTQEQGQANTDYQNCIDSGKSETECSGGSSDMVGTSGACTGLRLGNECGDSSLGYGTCQVVSYGGVDDLGCIIPISNQDSSSQGDTSSATNPSLKGFGEQCDNNPDCESGSCKWPADSGVDNPDEIKTCQ